MNSSDIAKLAGVSRSTVTRVLNNYDDIPEKTRRKVQAVIQKYGYVPNVAGQNLAGKRNRVIGVFIIDLYNDDDFTICRSTVFYDYIAYAVDIAKRLGYNLLLSIVDSRNIGEVQRLLMNKSVEGGIIICDTFDQEVIDFLAGQGCKLCLHNQRERSDSPNIVNVNSDMMMGAYLATKELLDKGHRKVAHATDTFQKYTVAQCYNGLIQALNEYGLDFEKKYLGFGAFHREEGGYKAVKEILRNNRGTLPPATMMASSDMSPGALEAVLEEGLRVPEDVSLIGVGSAAGIELTNPPISSTYIDHHGIASVMVSKLIELLDMGTLNEFNYTIKGTRLIQRSSVKDLTASQK
jgi:LacI family transcriptional regulator